MKLERIIESTPAFDRRHSDPNKNYGVHGVELKFVVKGDLGAVQFILYTNWHLPHVHKETVAKGLNLDLFLSPMPADLGYHSLIPMYDGHESVSDKCEYLGGKPCYYDGSTLNAHEPFDILVRDGMDALWSFLEEYYRSRFSEEGKP